MGTEAQASAASSGKHPRTARAPSVYREPYETTAARFAARLRAGRDAGESSADHSGDQPEILAWSAMGANLFLGLIFAIWSAFDSRLVADRAARLLRSGVPA